MKLRGAIRGELLVLLGFVIAGLLVFGLRLAGGGVVLPRHKPMQPVADHLKQIDANLPVFPGAKMLHFEGGSPIYSNSYEIAPGIVRYRLKYRRFILLDCTEARRIPKGRISAFYMDKFEWNRGEGTFGAAGWSPRPRGDWKTTQEFYPTSYRFGAERDFMKSGDREVTVICTIRDFDEANPKIGKDVDLDDPQAFPVPPGTRRIVMLEMEADECGFSDDKKE